MGESASDQIHTAPDTQETAPALDVRVLEPGDVCNLYAWDAAAGALRLERIVRPAVGRGADLARLPLLSAFAERAAAASLDTPFEAPTGRPRFADRMLEASASLDASAAVGSPLAGPGLLVLLLADPPNPPGAWVRARVLGAWRPAWTAATATDGLANGAGAARPLHGAAEASTPETLEAIGQWTILATPDADDRLAAVTGIGELPPERRARLTQALRTLGPHASGQGEPLGDWLSAHEAFALCNQARLLARRSRGSDAAEMPAGTLGGGRRRDTEETAPVAWRALSGVSPAELRALGPGAYAEAEHLVRLVPARFGHYLDELLFPDERVLFFAERGAIQRRPAGLRALVPGQQGTPLRAGLLLVTDQQVLCLRDYAPPDATLVEWGYLARSYPLGRAVGAALLPPGATLEGQLTAADLPGLPPSALPAVLAACATTDPETRRELTSDRLARLLVFFQARGGIEVGAMALPARALGGLDWAATLLRHFAPRLGDAAGADLRLRLAPQVEPWRPSPEEEATLETLGGEIAAPLRAALDDTLAATLRPGEELVAVAHTADLTVKGEGQVLAHTLALTTARLIGLRARRPTRAKPAADQVTTTVVEEPLGALASAMLQHSLLGCALWAHAPTGLQDNVEHARQERDGRAGREEEQDKTLAIGFASPKIVPFRALYVRLRALLNGPLAAG
jgi:hypothetical protein